LTRAISRLRGRGLVGSSRRSRLAQPDVRSRSRRREPLAPSAPLAGEASAGELPNATVGQHQHWTGHDVARPARTRPHDTRPVGTLAGRRPPAPRLSSLTLRRALSAEARTGIRPFAVGFDDLPTAFRSRERTSRAGGGDAIPAPTASEPPRARRSTRPHAHRERARRPVPSAMRHLSGGGAFPRSLSAGRPPRLRAIVSVGEGCADWRDASTDGKIALVTGALPGDRRPRTAPLSSEARASSWPTSSTSGASPATALGAAALW